MQHDVNTFFFNSREVICTLLAVLKFDGGFIRFSRYRYKIDTAHPEGHVAKGGYFLLFAIVNLTRNLLAFATGIHRFKRELFGYPRNQVAPLRTQLDICVPYSVLQGVVPHQSWF